MKFKSQLGKAALEELTEDTGEAGAEDNPEKKAGADDTPAADPAAAAPDAAATDAPAAAADAAAPTDAADPAAPDAGTPADGAVDPANPDAPDAGGSAADAGADDPQAADAAAAAAAVDATGDTPVDDGSDPIDADAQIVENEMEEVDTIGEKEDDVTEDVEKLTIAAESLETCSAAVYASMERGGMDPIHATLLRANLKMVSSSLKVKQLLIPALEDIDEPSAKVAAADDTKNQIDGFVKRIINAIKQAFERFSTWIVEVYKRLTNAFVAIERRAQTLAEKANSSEMVTGNIENKGLVAKLTVDGKTVTDVSGYLKAYTDFSKYMNDPGSYNTYLQALDQCETFIKDPAKMEEARGKISELLKRWSDDMEKHASNLTEKLHASKTGNRLQDANNKEIQFFGAALLGNQVLFVTLPGSAESIVAMGAVVRDGEDANTATSIEALSKADAVRICGQVAELAKELRESAEGNKKGVKELVANIAKRKDTFLAMTNAFVEKTAKETGLDSPGTQKVMMFLNKMFLSAPKLPVHALNRTVPRSLGFALDYVAASLGGAAKEGTPSSSTAVANV